MYRIKSLVLVFIITCGYILSSENDNRLITGDWETKIKFEEGALRIVFHITEEKGVLSGTWDSPDQNAYGLKIKQISFDGKDFRLSDKEYDFIFSGIYEKETKLVKGKFRQGSFESDFTLKRKVKQ